MLIVVANCGKPTQWQNARSKKQRALQEAGLRDRKQRATKKAACAAGSDVRDRRQRMSRVAGRRDRAQSVPQVADECRGKQAVGSGSGPRG